MARFRTIARNLASRPGFSLLAVLTLALGIGANAAIFSVADAALLRMPPFPAGSRLVLVWGYSAEVEARTGLTRLPWSPGDIQDLIARQASFDEVSWVRADRVNLIGGGEPERLGAVRIGPRFFETLGVHATLGRTFTSDDASGGRTVVIADRLWRRRFGADPTVLGRSIVLNNAPATVVGVMPERFTFPAAGDLSRGLGYVADTEVWTLDVLTPEQRLSRAGKSFALIGRLRAGVSFDAAAADLGGVVDSIAREHPAASGGWTARLVTMREQLVGTIRPALQVLLLAVGALLLIACANVANLLLVRASARQREVCLRQALGADRRQIALQLVAECVLMSLLAGVAGLVAASWLLRTWIALLPEDVPAVSAALVDWRTIVFTMALAAGAGGLLGLAPALHAMRVGVSEGLREGARGAVGGRRARRTQRLLVGAEIAAAAVLLVVAALLLQTFVRLIRIDPGFRSAGTLTAEVALARAQYPGAQPVAFFEALAARLRSVPGIDGVAVTSSIPLAGSEHLRQVTLEDQPPPMAGQDLIAEYRVVSPDFFRVMGIPLLEGETLPDTTPPGGLPLVVINQTMAETWFRGVNPLGRRIKLARPDQDGPWFTIAGIVGDTAHTALDSVARPQVYVDQRSDPTAQMLVVLRAASDPLRYAPFVRTAVTALDRNQPVGRIRSMDDIVDASIARQRFTMLLVVTFAGLALLLALVGLYAVMAHSVAERVAELGVRLALGATPGGLVRMVLLESLRIAAAGIAAGLAAALVLSRSLEALLHGVGAHDPLTFVAVPVLLLLTAVLGSVIPAWRAMRVAPADVLRS